MVPSPRASWGIWKRRAPWWLVLERRRLCEERNKDLNWLNLQSRGNESRPEIQSDSAKLFGAENAQLAASRAVVDYGCISRTDIELNHFIATAWINIMQKDLVKVQFEDIYLWWSLRI